MTFKSLLSAGILALIFGMFSSPSSGQVTMVSKMKVRPLSRDEMVPPTDLLDRIGAFVDEMASTDIPPNGEDIINSVLGGLFGTDND